MLPRHFTNLSDLLHVRAEQDPAKVGYVFLADGETDERQRTYQELDRRARSIAAGLQQTINPGDRVLLLCPPGLEFIEGFFACIHAGAVAVPAFPPDPSGLERVLRRLDAIAQDCSAAVILTTPEFASAHEILVAHAPGLAHLPLFSTNSDRGESDFRQPVIDPGSAAFLQYTSGSTGTPKGVVLTHANLLHNEMMINAVMSQDRDSVLVSWLPLFHDMGLIGIALNTAFLGARCVFMSPQHFLQRPRRWLDAITRHRATLSGAPNFGFELCLRKVSADERADLDLSSLQVMFNGAEPVRADTMDRFAREFADCGFRPEAFTPCYGLAEATLIVSGVPRAIRPRSVGFDPVALESGTARPAQGARSRQMVSVGIAAGQQSILIVDPQSGQIQPPGSVGEIWVTGPNVGQGYWERPEESVRVFAARPRSGSGQDARYLRTGDLGFQYEGELYIAGRLKDLLIVRGRNLAPQDLERVAEDACTGLRPGCSAVFQAVSDDTELLVAVHEFDARKGAGPDEVVRALREAVTREFEVELDSVILITPRTIAKTSSGKIQRRACQLAFEKGQLSVLHRWDAERSAVTGNAMAGQDTADIAERIEAALRAQLASAAHLSPSEAATAVSLSGLGVDSLAAVEIGTALQREVGVCVPITELLRGRDIAALSRKIAEGGRASTAPLPVPSESGTEFPLSDGQLALWYLHEQAPESTAYNVSTAVRIRQPLDPALLRQALDTLADRHEALRTRFAHRGGTPYQQVLESRPVDFQYQDASVCPDGELLATLAQDADKPFDLGADPLLRVRLYRRADHDHYLLLAVHHIITDFWSLAVLADELGMVYAAMVAGTEPALPEVGGRYADFVQWQNSWLGSPEAAAQLDAWAQTLSPPAEPLRLPTDRPRPPVRTSNGSAVQYRLDQRLSQEAVEFARRHGVTTYTLLLTVLQTLLHRYTGQSDLTVGSPAAARERPELARVFGFFVNTLAVRLDLTGDPSFASALDSSSNAVLDAIDRQRIPFVRVVERVQPARDASRTPLFQVMYVHQQSQFTDPARSGLAAFGLGTDGARADLHGLAIESVGVERGSTQFDLLLMSAHDGPGLSLSLQFNTDLFDRATAVRMLGHFERLLRDAIAHPGRPLSQLELLTPGETAELESWNDTARSYPNVRWIHEEFSARAAVDPDAVALVSGGQSMAYRELDQRSSQLALRLGQLGLGPGDFVGIAADRSPELVIGLLGILKAGAAYVPLDPEYPRERLAHMLADAAPEVVLTLPHLRESLPGGGYQCILLGTHHESVAPLDSSPPTVPLTAGDAAYMIYTSGSTGRPKGVVNTHQAIRNRLAWMQDAYGCGPGDRIAQKTPTSFDVSVWEFFWPLMNGATLVLARPGGHRDAAYLAELFAREEITIAHFVPTMLQLFLAEPGAGACRSLRQVICSGEALPAELARRFSHTLPWCALDNLYGPTEAAVDVTSWRCQPGGPRDFVPIGRPIANVTVRLLDRHGKRVPAGVPGELCIGGVALARGYHNLPELTAERFIADPYSVDPLARLYRTGDVARYHADGVIEYLGRTDHQVKLHGNRIELGEIAAVLCGHLGVRDAAAVVHGEGADARLVAYVTSEDGRRLSDSELRGCVAGRLPQYMVPAVFVPLGVLPMTPSGKIDRSALPAPEGACRAVSSVVPPRTPEEQILSRVFGEVLMVGEVGVTDNFFEIGGDSIRALQVRVRARMAGLEFSIPDLLQYQTIQHLAQVARPVLNAAGQARSCAPFSLISEADRNRLPESVVDAYPLAKLQEGMVFHSESSPDYETYVMGFHLGGRFAEQAMRAALGRLAGRHPLLRTSFEFTTFSESLQLVHADARIPLIIHDISGQAPEAQQASIDQFMRERKWRKFDWSQPPLLQLDIHLRSSRSFQCTFSHPLFDGWSMALLITELMGDYGALARGAEPPQRPELRLTYADFVALELDAINSAEHQQFWRHYLADCERSEIPRWPSRRQESPARHRRTTVPIDRAVSEALQRLASEVGTSLKSVVLAAHMLVVSMLTGRADVTTGIITNGRPEELDGERVPGVFLNTVPLRMRFTGGTWRDLIRQTLAAEREVLPYRRYPLAELVRTIGGQAPLFDTGFNYIHFHIYQALLNVEGLEVIGWSSPSDQTYFPLTAYFHLDVASGELLCFLDLDDSVFDPEQVTAIQGYYRAALTAMAANPDGRYERQCLLPALELRRLETWNQTDVPWPADRPEGVHRRFMAAAAAHPAMTAVRAAGGSLSYAELDVRSNQLAHRLISLGVTPETTLGISLSRDTDLAVALLGVLKSGAAYVPMDPAFPQERLRHMMTDSGAPIVITDSAAAKGLPETAASLLLMDTEISALRGEPTTAPAVPFEPDRLAYVIYTSGSTGVPKGVEITHRALDNLLLAFERELRWSADEVLLAVTTLSFDIAGLEIFLPLATGARLELATEAEAADPQLLAARIADTGVTMMQATPATWRMLVEAGWAGSRSLRILCGGEALTAELAEELRRRSAGLWNVYGPTETTIWSAAARLDLIEGAPPIGRPLANTTFHVLDNHGGPVPVGTPGELYIGGLGLARGYRNRPDLTAAAFSTLAPGPGQPPVRLYRTGDLVRRRPDGALEYLGRLDFQVKVRGFRIELGEIEAVLGRHPTLRQAVVLARKERTGEARLVAYLVPRNGSEVDVPGLRAAVAAELPGYMVPSAFVVLAELPYTPNGKVDRKALPEPSEARPAVGPGFVAPTSEDEKRIARIWEAVLHVDRVGIDDPFFELGGHSLLMVRMHSRIRAEVADLPLMALFEHFTVRRLARFLAGQEAPADQLRQVRDQALRRRALPRRAGRAAGPAGPQAGHGTSGSDS